MALGTGIFIQVHWVTTGEELDAVLQLVMRIADHRSEGFPSAAQDNCRLLWSSELDLVTMQRKGTNKARKFMTQRRIMARPPGLMNHLDSARKKSKHAVQRHISGAHLRRRAGTRRDRYKQLEGGNNAGGGTRRTCNPID
ncbi:hypothetical protein B0H13DRAFT_1896119 [Mycena leptocephala]|nr:hypothetical protein B0H13DRAFT_1896119 [Mycena leptocephala]